MLRSVFRGFKIIIYDSSTKHTRSFSSANATAQRLQDKVAIITGGASGLGKATAHQFIQHGARVIIADVDSNMGQQVATELGPGARFVQCDVTVEAQVRDAVEVAMGLYGKLDVMYNNAGIPGPSVPPSITDLDLDEFDRVMKINVRGIMAGIKHAARAMIPAGSGSILCTSSICGVLGGLGPHTYTISKFAIPGIVKSVASELCKNGIRVNCISPGPIPTPMSVEQVGQFYPGATREKIVEIMNGVGELKGANCEEMDLAKAALYLSSDEAKYISGHNLVVDGGLTCFKSFRFPHPDETV